MSSYYYTLHKERLDYELKNLKDYQKVNNFLKSNDWFIVSPFFFIGYDLNLLLALSKEKGNHKAEVTKQVYQRFYWLPGTASFIEGYCDRCDHIRPFLMSIEHSLILAFQRDYEGSIKTIIPIIEGILRQYLVIEGRFEMAKIGFKDLKKSFEKLKDSILDNCREYLSNGKDENERPLNFSEAEINTLFDLEKEYYSIWFSFIVDFIKHSLYLKTTSKPITNEINRHAILHEFGLDIEYNLENYIKIYFVIQFLTWIFLRKERKSLLNNIEESRYSEKVMAYKRIIENAKLLQADKAILYKRYPNYKPDILFQEISVYM